MTTTPLPDTDINTDALATAAVGDLAAGRWSALTEQVDLAMREELSEDALAAAWAQVVGRCGALESAGTPRVSRAADLTVTDTPLAMEAGGCVARISSRDDRSIAGLDILPKGTL